LSVALKVSESVLGAFKSVGFQHFTRRDVARCRRIVMAAHPADIDAYSYVVARNWAVDCMRRANVAADRALAAARAERVAAEEAAALKQARAEFRYLVQELGSITEKQGAQLDVLFRRRLMGASDDELLSLYPHTSRCCRDQWVSRGRKLLAPIASDHLKGYIL